VHLIVAKQLRELTQGTDVRSTGYFNHSWAPDLVISSRDRAERGVFLRFNVRDATFADDLRYLSEGGPVFLDLKAANPFEVEPDDRSDFNLDQALATDQEKAVLVTEAPAIDQFESHISKDRDVRRASQEVIVGGQGLVDEDAVDTIADSWQAARSAVSAGDAQAVRTALDAFERYLSRVSAIDVEASLRGDWIASGRTAEDFPGSEDWRINDRAPWEIAKLVISLVDREQSVDPTRWREVAEAVSMSRLGHELFQIGEHRTGGGVNDLACAGVPLWTAQYAYVPPLASDSMSRFDWSFGGYSLAVDLITRQAYFTDIANKWNRVPRPGALPDARARLETLTDAHVAGVGLITPEENVQHQLRPQASMSLAQRLEQFLGHDGDPAWRAARLTSVEMRVPGSATMAYIDFGRSVVRVDAPIPLRTFVLLCARYVAGLEQTEIEELESALP
jgi:hypothetical protein